MSRGKRTFDEALLKQLREMSVSDVLMRLGMYWKEDRDFRPMKNAKTKRLHVSVGPRVFELLVTDKKWFDVKVDRGGGGSIDLTMHLLNVDFVDAVQTLNTDAVREQRP